MNDETHSPALSADAQAIVAATLVNTVALLRANRWKEDMAQDYALKVFDNLRAEIARRASESG